MKATLLTILVLIILAGVGGYAYAYSGLYPIGADQPHSRFVNRFLHMVSDRAIAHHAKGVKVPADVMHPDSAMLVKGAGEYADMCSACHLAPGFRRSPLHDGLYPHPPWFTRGTDVPYNEFFWETKHGVKDTGMPAWGRSHSDADLWAVVAFVEQMDKMTPDQYRKMVASAPPDTEMLTLPMPEADAAIRQRADTTSLPQSMPRPEGRRRDH